MVSLNFGELLYEFKFVHLYPEVGVGVERDAFVGRKLVNIMEFIFESVVGKVPVLVFIS